MNISVIVPTYNRPKALRLCLLSLAGQSLLPAEVLVADDGSGPETKETVQELQRALKDRFPIRHIWQEDIGFRKPKIMNEAVRRSIGDYLVIIDGDCMAHRHFVRSHRDQSGPKTILSGKRVEIGKRLTDKLLEDERVLNSITPELLADLRGKRPYRARKIDEGFFIKNSWIRKRLRLDHLADDGVIGCNISLSKDLFIAINGCDEDFLDGSIEDNDLGIRVVNQGGKVASVKKLAIIYHLWHPTTWNFESENYRFNENIMLQRIASREPVCRNGIRRL
jgi:glycosyltransferase involved in cell wall biosynthesis